MWSNLCVCLLLPALLVQSSPIQRRTYGGVNDYSCIPSPDHPNPVVLVHGLTANGWINFFLIGPELASQGYCAFEITYGQWTNIPVISGLAPMEDSAKQLEDFIDNVLTKTNATNVDIVGK